MAWEKMATGVPVNELFERIAQAETRTSELLREVEELEKSSINFEQLDKNPELNALQTANSKLKYQILHLQRSIAEEEARQMQSMTNVLRVVEGLFTTTIRKLYPGFSQLKGSVQSSSGKFGDYKCNAAVQISQKLKSQGQSVPPKQVAATIAEKLENTEPFLEKYEVAGVGFINVFLKPSFVAELVRDVIVNGARPPPIDRKLRVVVDFSSPNIAKEMHVGHLRSTIIGETICRLLEFVGHDVLRLNHIGDWGTQFGMLTAHLKDKFPDYTKVSPPIGDLQAFYKESKKRFDDEEDFKKRAYACVVKLQNHDPEIIKGWQLICDVSRKEFQSIYDRLGVTIIERGESFYQPLMPEVINDLEAKSEPDTRLREILK